MSAVSSRTAGSWRRGLPLSPLQWRGSSPSETRSQIRFVCSVTKWCNRAERGCGLMVRIRARLYRPGRGFLSANPKKIRLQHGAPDSSHQPSPETPSSVVLLLIGSSVDLAKSSLAQKRGPTLARALIGGQTRQPSKPVWIRAALV